MKNYDVVIVGASYAGAFLAWELARQGHQVGVLEKRPIADIGKEYEIIMIDIDTFSKTGLERSKDDEFLAYINHFNIFSPSQKSRKSVQYSTLLINGHSFIQRILAAAKDAGAEFIQAAVENVLIDGEWVHGVEASNGDTYHARVTVDASGVASAVRKKLPEAWGFVAEEKFMSPQPAVAYRQVRTSAIDPAEIQLFFCFEGGYIWRTAIDLGFGGMGDTSNVADRVNAFIVQQGWELGPIQSESRGVLPIRQPLTNLVGNGFAVIGDAAYMINTVRGGGITPGLRAGVILGQVLHQALLDGSTSQTDLWIYNQRFHTQLGRQLSYQDALREALLSLSQENMEFAFSHDLLTSSDMEASMAGKVLHMSTGEKLKRGLLGIRKPNLLLHFDSKIQSAQALYEHFSHFPDIPTDFAKWLHTTQKIQEKLFDL